MKEFRSCLVFPRILISFGTLLLGVFFGEGFVVPLFANYSFCLILKETKNRSLMISITLGTILISTLIATSYVLSTLRTNLWNLIHISLSTNFLMHYFFWCALEFDLLDYDKSLFIVCLHSSLPSLCCFIFTMLFCFYTGFRFSWCISLFGFLTLRLSLAASERFRGGSDARKSYVIWNSIFDMCTTLLLNVFPLLAYLLELFTTELFENIWAHLSELVFLLCGAKLLVSLLADSSITLTRRAFNTPWHKTFTLVTVASGALTALKYTNVPHVIKVKPYESCLTFAQLLLFVGMLVMRHYRQLHTPIKALLVFFVAFLCSVLLLSARVPSVACITLWNGPVPSPFSFTLLLCVLSAVLPVVMHDQFHQRRLQVAFAVFLLSFHVIEWQLFQSTVLSEKWFLISSVIAVLIASLHLIRPSANGTSVKTLNLVFTPELLGTCVFAPSGTKLFIIGLNHLGELTPTTDNPTGFHESTRFPHHRVQYDRSFVLGFYMVVVGLVCGGQLLQFLTEPMRRPRRTDNVGRVSNMVFSAMNMFGLFVYFRAASGMCWSTLSTLVLGHNVLNRSILFPIALGLSGLSLYTSPMFSRTDARHTLGSAFVGTLPIYMLVISGFVFTALVLLGEIFTVTISLLLSLLAIPVAASGLLLIVSVTVCRSVKHIYCLTTRMLPALRSGLIGSCLLLTFLVRIDPAFASYSMLFGVSVYSTCLFILVNELCGLGQFDREGASVASPIRQFDTCEKLSARAHVRLKLMVSCFGLIGFAFPVLVKLFTPNLPMWSKEPLLQALSVSTFTLGQLVSDRFSRFVRSGVQSHRSCDSGPAKSGHRISMKKTVEYTLLTWFINFTVVIAVCLLLGCSWNATELHVLFIPWLFFGLTGYPVKHNPKVVPLVGFTAFLLISLYSQLYSTWVGHNPPLPTFTRQWFRISYSYWLWGAEFLLTTLLIPIHFVFLADQAKLRTFNCDLVHMTPCSLTWSHATSVLCGLILLSAYILTPCCLAYLVLASSPVSALYGLYTFVICCYSLLWIDIRTGPNWLIH